jgi:hypothetical protein
MQGETDMTVDFDLKYAVIQLHDIARLIESKLGIGAVSADVRAVADRLEATISAEVK